MRRTLTYFSFVIVGLSILAFACVSPKPIDTKTNNTKTNISKTVYAAADMNEINVKKGEDFEITLDSNPTTGFSWALAEDLDAKMIEEIDNVYGSNNSDDNNNTPLVGAGGIETWTFKALDKGEATIKMKYCQPFDANNPTEVKTIIVKIQ